jgi:hypothetical protein
VKIVAWLFVQVSHIPVPPTADETAISLLSVFYKAAKHLLRRQINGKYRKCLLKESQFMPVKNLQKQGLKTPAI